MTFQECYDSIHEMLGNKNFTVTVSCQYRTRTGKSEVEWELWVPDRERDNGDCIMLEAGSPESLITQLSDILAPKGVESVGTIEAGSEA